MKVRNLHRNVFEREVQRLKRQATEARVSEHDKRELLKFHQYLIDRVSMSPEDFKAKWESYEKGLE